MMMLVLSFVGALLLALGLTPLCRRLALHLDVVDRPGARKHQSVPVPMFGGLAIAIAHLLVIGGGFLLLRFGRSLGSTGMGKYQFDPNLSLEGQLGTLLGLVLGGIAILVLGMVDDARNLSIKPRLVTEIVVAIVVVLMGVKLSLPFLASPLPELITICWIVGLTNSINLIDGLDGLCAGVSAVASVTLAAVMVWGQQPLIAALLLALTGGILGFLPFNFPRARIYMGSAGSMYLGYSLACATALATFTMNHNVLASLALPIVVFAVPLYDTFSVIVLRLREGVSIGRADQNHLHHRLLRLGFSRKQTSIFIWLLTFATALPAMLLVNSGILDTAIVMLVTLAVLGLIALIERVQGHFVTQSPDE